VGVSAEVTALATAGAGAKMEFTDDKQAREFMTAAAHEPVKDSPTGWDPTSFTHWVADQVDGHQPAGGGVIGKIAFSMDLTDKGNVDALANASTGEASLSCAATAAIHRRASATAIGGCTPASTRERTAPP